MPTGRYSWIDGSGEDHSDRWELTARERRVAEGIPHKWRVSRLWGLPHDAESVQRAVHSAYMRGDREQPKEILFADGPYDGVRLGGERGCDYLWSGVLRGEAREPYWGLAYGPHYTRAISRELVWGFQRSFRTFESRSSETVDLMHARGHERHPARPCCAARTRAGDKVLDVFDDLFRAAAMADFLWRSNLLPAASTWESIEELLFACGPFWWANAETFVACKAPVTRKLDAGGLLHAESGPAIAYADGAEGWFWHGRRIERALLERRAEITLAEITAESNVERRRLLLELHGIERAITGMGAKKIAEDPTGILWSCAGIMLVEVVNATKEPDGTYRRYFLRVPPHMRTAREAVAWTFGLRPEAYEPASET